jgi:hypothetical protein
MIKALRPPSRVAIVRSTHPSAIVRASSLLSSMDECGGRRFPRCGDSHAVSARGSAQRWGDEIGARRTTDSSTMPLHVTDAQFCAAEMGTVQRGVQERRLFARSRRILLKNPLSGASTWDLWRCQRGRFLALRLMWRRWAPGAE